MINRIKPTAAMVAAVAAMLAIVFCGDAYAASRTAEPVSVDTSANTIAPAARPSLTAADVSSWLDGLMSYATSNADIAGAVVVVVKDGGVLTERGYGYRDMARRLPMEPESTLIRPGSITKLFTWTAVMQLVEQGRLDLDTDVNRYLDFRVPDTGRPITLRHIMTHTSGFEESLRDLLQNPDGRTAPMPLGAYLRSHLPPRIYPTGEIPAYSNYASALAGHIVSRITGQPFEEYVEQHILTPLGMAHSSLRQPLPADLKASLSSGYRVASQPPQYFEYLVPSPAGSLSCTADDMARFMIAHLQGGTYAGRRILSDATSTLMHAVQPKIYPALNGMALGFYETSRNGHRVLAHNGGTQFFHSDLHLFMDDNVGIFISLNSAGTGDSASRIHDALFHGFADRYFPASPAHAQSSVAPQTAVEHARMMAGAWESSRRSASTFMSIAGLLSPLTIEANADGTVTVPVPAHGDMVWHEISPFVWEQVGGQERMQALTTGGHPVMLGLGMAPPAAFLPVPAYRSPAWLLPACEVSILVTLLSGLAWPVGRIARKLYGMSPPRPSRLYTCARAACLGVTGVILSFVITLGYLSDDAARLSTASDAWILVLEGAALIVLPAAAMVGILNLLSVWRERRGWFFKVESVLMVAGFGVLLWAAVVCHLMNFNTQY